MWSVDAGLVEHVSTALYEKKLSGIFCTEVQSKLLIKQGFIKVVLPIIVLSDSPIFVSGMKLFLK